MFIFRTNAARWMATKRIEPLDLAQESSSHEDGVPFLRIQHILYAHGVQRSGTREG